MVDGQDGGLLSGARTRPTGVGTEGHGSSRAWVETGWKGVGGADERWRLLQGGAGLQEAGLLLEGWGLAVQRGCGGEGGPQEGRGLVEGGGGGCHRNLRC